MSEVRGNLRPRAAAASDPIMTVYEAHRKNVFRARARAQPGQKQQQNFCGDLSLFVGSYASPGINQKTNFRI